MEPREEFTEVLTQLGCIVEGGHPFMDGQQHRIKTIGDKGKEQAGFYTVYMDGTPAGYAKNHRTGQEVRWKAQGYHLSDEEKAKIQAEVAQKKMEREKERSVLQKQAVERIKYYMKDYRPIDSELTTPYLQKKGIKAHTGIYTDKSGQTTFIPLYKIDGQLTSMQYINADGSKRMAKNAQQEGSLHIIDGKDLKKAETIILAEGYATAATIAEATSDNVACIVAINAGNMLAVANELKNNYPNKMYLVAGDDDLAVGLKEGVNPGRDKALKAAEILNGEAVFPIFAPGEQSVNNKEFTDFNDLAQKSAFGKEGVRKQINEKINAQRDKREMNLQQQQLKDKKIIKHHSV